MSLDVGGLYFFSVHIWETTKRFPPADGQTLCSQIRKATDTFCGPGTCPKRGGGEALAISPRGLAKGLAPLFGVSLGPAWS